MVLYVATWFHRGGTGWTRGIAAFTTEAEAVAELERHVLEGRALAGEDEREADRVAQDLKCSTAEVVAYTLRRRRLTLEVLAEVVTRPPRGDAMAAFDPLAGAGTWWSSARVVRAWWGGTDPEARRARDWDLP